MRLRRRVRSNRRSRVRRACYWLAGAAGVFLLVSCLAVLALRWVAPPVTAFMLLDPVAQGRYDYDWVAFDEVASGMPIAVIAAEDQKFPIHY